MLVTAFAVPAYAENAKERLQEATGVLNELMGAEDKGIPKNLLEKARCAIIIPGAKKGGFFIGAQYGRGFALCRNENTGVWAPRRESVWKAEVSEPRSEAPRRTSLCSS